MSRIKLVLCLLFISTLLCGFIACNEVDSNATPSDIMSKIKTAIPEKEMIDGITYLESGNLYESAAADEVIEDIIIDIYKLDISMVESYSVWITTDNVVTEMGIFKLKDDTDAEQLIEILTARIDTLKTAAEDMKSEEFTKAENAVVSSAGKYVYYLVTNINSILEEVILNEITENQITA